MRDETEWLRALGEIFQAGLDIKLLVSCQLSESVFFFLHDCQILWKHLMNKMDAKLNFPLQDGKMGFISVITWA